MIILIINIFILMMEKIYSYILIKTKKLVDEFFEIHKMDKLKLNDKYITKNDIIFD